MIPTCLRQPLLAILLLAAVVPVGATSDGITPPKIFQTVAASFPAELAATTLPRGEATVLISIDANGQLADMLVTSFSHAAFAREAVAVLPQWRYTAARRQGEPVGTRLELRFDFSTTTRVATFMPVDTVNTLIHARFQPTVHSRICSPGDLDLPFAVLQTVSPQPAGGPAATGRTVVDFYVDETGRARMPVILESTHPALADAAVQALGEWQFTAPTRQGRPVIVRLRQEFVFAQGS